MPSPTYYQTLRAKAKALGVSNFYKMNTKQLEQAIQSHKATLPLEKASQAGIRLSIPPNPNGSRLLTFSVMDLEKYANLFLMPTYMIPHLLKYMRAVEEYEFNRRNWSSETLKQVNKTLHEYFVQTFLPWLDEVAGQVENRQMAQNFWKYIDYLFPYEKMQIDMQASRTENMDYAWNMHF